MTNGEKIKALFPDMYQVEQSLEAWDSWWNAEYKESTTKNNLGVDCISREQALVAIRNLYPSMPRVDFNGSLRKWVDKYKPYIDCDDAIKQLPSVTLQPRKGKWISHKEHCENLGVMPSGLGAYKWCSNCDCGIDVREWHRNNYNYCPNCGAYMREVEE